MTSPRLIALALATATALPALGAVIMADSLAARSVAELSAEERGNWTAGVSAEERGKRTAGLSAEERGSLIAELSEEERRSHNGDA
ncbi:MAG: hypothetical protein Kow0058_14290 [Roseovarius sp.]